MRKVVLLALVALLVAAFVAFQNTLAWVGQQGPLIPYIPMAATCGQTAAVTTPAGVGSTVAKGLGNLVHDAATQPPPSTVAVKGTVDGVLGVVESWWADFAGAARGDKTPSKGPKLLHQYPPGDPRGNPNLADYNSCSCPTTTSTVAVAAGGGFTADQRSIAGTAIAVGKAHHMPAQGWVVALAAGLQESGLRNLDYGDQDSLGVWQERPSAGWGTPAQILSVPYAAGKFYDALDAIVAWQTMPVTAAAQAVEQSAYPGAYAKWETDARALVALLGAAPRPRRPSPRRQRRTAPPGAP